MCFLDHLGQVSQKFAIDQYGLRKEDVQRTNRQNWASAQCICAKKARACLHDLRTSRDAHQERTLGLRCTCLYVLITLTFSFRFR